MARTWLTRAAIAAALLVAAAVAVFAFASMQPQVETSLGLASPSPGPCSPDPCRNEQGFVMWVSNVTVQGDLVRMRVMFKNSSNATHASPDDLSLIDHSNHTAGITTQGTDCNTWSRHEFNHGQTFGPVDICFQVTNTTAPFTLRWTPDFGFFCCDDSLSISPS
ncbi:MAG TPA: hypothetical protein VJT78_14310 [Candidatus Dormibacteraeota bacterium]|nr:hypothetical protein [Candidatus Dormibacteraeota bacterium]